MTTAKKLIAAAGAAGAGEAATYVDDVFSTYLYEGTNADQGIQNGINLGDFGVGTSTKFDRNVDFLSRSSDFTSNSDSKTFTFSCWVFATPAFDGNQRTLYATDSSDNGILIAIQENGTLSIEAWNGGVRTLQLSTSTVIGTNVWTNILVSLDFANSSNRYIYFNDAAATVTYNTYNDANIEFTRPTHYIGIWGNGSTRGLHDDSLAHMYLDYTYRDLSTESNRRIFIDANGGSTSASSLTALNPIMYLPMTTAYAVGKNAGTGGDFTSNGSPTIVENGTEYVADSGKGGMVWSKGRTSSYDHGMMDTERGRAGGNLQPHENFATQVAPAGQDLVSFNSNGYSIGPKYTGSYNISAAGYVSWTFRKAPGFFDIVTYTGTGSYQSSIAHNLGSIPGMIIVKRTDSTGNWVIWHRSVDPKNLQLNSASAATTEYAIQDVTSTTFGVTNYSTLKASESGASYVAYLFAHDAQEFGTDSDESIIKCGSYTGNGSTDGPTIDLGFEPQWVLIKQTSGTGEWNLFDSMRGITNGTYSEGGRTALLRPDGSDAEENEGTYLELNPTGFKMKSGDSKTNDNGETHIYMAIRRPHKPAEEFAATDLFSATAYAGDNSSNRIIGSLPAGDMAYVYTRNYDSYAYIPAIWNRLTGGNALRPDRANQQVAQATTLGWDNQIGQLISNGSTNINNTSGTFALYNWRRAPGFFDVVTYTGSSSAGTMTINHNLGVVPEMMWVKASNASYNWWAAHTFSGSGAVRQYPALNGTQAGSTESYGTSLGLNAQPTSTAFVVNTDTMIGRDYDWVAWLFASVDGISKVGSYTGTGNDLNVDCGFTNGARFVLIKRTDSTGDWYLWDSARGIVAGEEPYVLINAAASEQTATDYVDPLSSGFTVTSSAPAALNASGGTYLFYAIA